MPTRANQNVRRSRTLAYLRAGRFATLDEAAQFAGVSRQRVHQWIKQHAIDWQTAWKVERTEAVATMIARQDERMKRRDARRGRPSEDRNHVPSMMAPLLAVTPRQKGPSKDELKEQAEAALRSGVKVKRLPPSPRA